MFGTTNYTIMSTEVKFDLYSIFLDVSHTLIYTSVVRKGAISQYLNST